MSAPVTSSKDDRDCYFQTVHIDDSLIVLSKAAGLLAVPGRGQDKQDCLSRRVQRRYPEALIVHRLDMATSGLMLMARGAGIQSALAKLFESRAVRKRYTAIVEGDMRGQQRAMRDPEGWHLIDLAIAADWRRRPLRVINSEHGKSSQTRWRALAFDGAANTTRLELEPVTGRSHQLRVHLQALGHPIVGDALYGRAEVPSAAPRMMLHATRLAFEHPVSGELLSLTSEPDF
jgi:tRNA pseudouridine32 synthase / 23S rRNA pseudouridine746 synthase